jgi:hypothetical protein
VLHAIVLNAIGQAAAAEEATHPLVWPAWVFPLIAAVVFIFLGLVMHSFRDVANRHNPKSTSSAASGHTTEH